MLTLGALGIVYGDIGTSPLYAINEIFLSKGAHTITPLAVYCGISLVFWALTLVVAIKYVFFVLRADSEGEGGVFALYNLIKSIPGVSVIIPGLLVIAAGLLYGDGIITPAISVISAVEGLNSITNAFKPYIVPLTIAILSGLFFVQKQGTHKVGKVFGPIMLVWFATIGTLGFLSIAHTPSILQALNPMYALECLFNQSFTSTLLILGSVMLVITGGEAMYADMGHFGRTPIQLGWYAVAYPALVLNYLGQGAYLLSGRPIQESNIFYSMVPQSALIPVVILATMATIIASQALISGAFSLTMQAISLRLLPYLPIVHTHEDHEGQVYLGSINAALYIGTILLVCIFQSSTKLAGAYGLAVSGVMFVTTLGMMIVAQKLWHWKPIVVAAVFVPFAILDALFLTSNSLKLFEGGWIPLTIGLAIYGIIQIWQWGRYHTIKTFDESETITIGALVKRQQADPDNQKRTVVFLSRKEVSTIADRVPIQLQRYIDRHETLPEHIVLLNVVLTKQPHAHPRTIVNHFTKDNPKNGTVTGLTVQFGFMEDPDIEPLVKEFIRHKDIPSHHAPDKWIFNIIHERVSIMEHADVSTKLRFMIYQFLQRNSDTADHYFGLGQDHQLIIDVLPVRLT